MKTICIYHSRDLDGWMSAAIVRKQFEEKHEKFMIGHITLENLMSGAPKKKLGFPYPMINFLGWDHGDPIPDLSDYDEVIMCDISFSKEEMENIFNRLDTNFIWIDHHISAIKQMGGEYVTSKLTRISQGNKNSIKGIQRTDFAACELTWKYFFPKKFLPPIGSLI